MTAHVQKNTVDQTIAAIFALDLDAIKFKLMDKEDGYGWTREEADRQELEYRRFLALNAKYPDEAIVPSRNVDRFWHAHILDTMKYAEDCDKVFGHFLHHFPYFGMRDAEDADNAAKAAQQTKRLYEQEFGGVEQADTAAAYCARAGQAYCARATAEAQAGEDRAYCARSNVAYCARAAAGDAARPGEAAAYCARASESYCARAQQVKAEEVSAYCARANESYCARAAHSADIVTGKGRPTLDKVVA